MHRILYALVFALLLSPHKASAQASQQAQDFMSEMIAITNDISEETAKEQAAKCVAMGDKLKTMQDLIPPQRLYFEAEVERCLFHAMNNGNFSDATGDQCSHHIDYASKLAQVVEQGLKVPGLEGEYMANFASQMESAISIGQQLGCKHDYAQYAKIQEAAAAAGQKTPKEPDFAFMEEIQGVISSITPESAKDDLGKCTALKQKLAGKQELFPFEQHYYPALIENCLSTAMQKGASADADGDACAHLYRYGQESLLALAEGSRQPSPFDAFLEMIREELKGVVVQAKELSCKQDFTGLKEG